MNFITRLKSAHKVLPAQEMPCRIYPGFTGLPIKHEAHHPLTLALLRGIPGHGTGCTSMGALGPGAAVGTTPAEEATDHSQQNQEALSSHAGKLAVHTICWQACVQVKAASIPAPASLWL